MEVEEKSDADRKQAANPPGVELQRPAYRAQLVALEQKFQEAYDKAVLILSGGALGLSLVVVKDYLRLRGGGGSGLIALEVQPRLLDE